jgi:hypothetical protein
MNLKTIYQSVLNENIQVQTLDEALNLANNDPDDLEYKEWIQIFVIDND